MRGTSSNTRKEVILLALAGAVAGCVAQKAPYVDSLHRFGATGRPIQPHLKPAADPSVDALYQAFDAAVKEAEGVK